ncbi:glycoside hydrolase family 3 protein [Nocardiopsis coralliicola]
MPRRLLAPLCALLLLVPACSAEGGGSTPPPEQGGGEVLPDAEAEQRAAEVLDGMALEEKIGQLLVLDVLGTTPEENADRLETLRPGGLIYFPQNLESGGAEGIAELSNGLQEAAASGGGAAVPLLIGIDQEQGMVSRLPVGTRFPDAMAVGATGSEEQAAALAGTTAAELRALGINLDYAPAADVNTDPDNPVIGIRSFGSDPEQVGALAVAEAEAFEENGVAPVVKHFPGHGDTDVDSHTGLPVVEKSREQWEQEDLPPFRAAIDAGVDMIMTAHVFLPALDDSGEPSTLSPEVVDGVLRDELGYDGVVTTDALNMEGVRETHDDGEIAVRTVEAGVDQLLMPPDPQAAFDALSAAVEEGRITEERIDESARRILEVKAKRGLFDAGPVDAQAAADTVGAADHKAAAQELADASATLLGGADAVPVAQGGSVAVSGVGSDAIAEALQELGVEVADSAAGADLAVVGVNGARGEPDQQALVQRAVDSGTPVVAVGQGAPYDAAVLDGIDAYLAVYSSVGVARTAAARVIAGEAEPAGALPVDIPGTPYERGDGAGG